MKTTLIYISGAHGVGKDTIIQALAQRLERTGASVWVMPEMPFPPDMRTGSMDFQLRYTRVMKQREEIVDMLMEENIFDYIICNRHPIDVEIYNEYLTGKEPDRHVRTHWAHHEVYKFLITCPSTIVKSRIEERLKVDTHREEWNETDMEYFNDIQNSFKKFNEQSYIETLFRFDPFFKEINNIGTVDKAVEQIMEWLL